jgi:hypothetical protein
MLGRVAGLVMGENVCGGGHTSAGGWADQSRAEILPGAKLGFAAFGGFFDGDDGRAIKLDLGVFGDFDGDGGVFDVGDDPVDSGGGDDLVASFQAADELLVFFLLLLLRADEEEVKDNEDEDEGEEVHQHVGLLRSSAFGQEQSERYHGVVKS